MLIPVSEYVLEVTFTFIIFLWFEFEFITLISGVDNEYNLSEIRINT